MRESIKKLLPQNSLLFKVYRKIYWWATYKRRGYPKAWSIDILKAYANYKYDVKFIQIGSNNGVYADPIHKYVKSMDWKGVLVEPVPHLFEELKENYNEFAQNLCFENSAIANEGGIQKFYRIKNQQGVPQLYTGLGSFNKDIILQHLSKDIVFEDFFVEDVVKTITFKDLLEKYSMKEINLIHIDTEGFDYEILKQIPFEKIIVDVIMFEHSHLSIADYKNALRLLKRNKYKVGIRDKVDTIALKEQIFNSILV